MRRTPDVWDRQVDQMIQEFERLRVEWVAILGDNPTRTDAPDHLVRVNAKLELLYLLRGAREPISCGYCAGEGPCCLAQ